MRRFNNPTKNIAYFIYRWITPIADPLMLKSSLPNFPKKLINTYPILYEKSSGTPFDAHYFYQNIWAFKKINKNKPKEHFDISSKLIFAGLLSAITKVTYVDFHPLKIVLKILLSNKVI